VLMSSQAVRAALLSGSTRSLMAWLEPEHLSFEDLQAMIGVLDERISGIIQDGGTRPWGQDF